MIEIIIKSLEEKICENTLLKLRISELENKMLKADKIDLLTVRNLN